MRSSIKCPACEGFSKDTCWACSGKGKVSKSDLPSIYELLAETGKHPIFAIANRAVFLHYNSPYWSYGHCGLEHPYDSVKRISEDHNKEDGVILSALICNDQQANAFRVIKAIESRDEDTFYDLCVRADYAQNQGEKWGEWLVLWLQAFQSSDWTGFRERFGSLLLMFSSYIEDLIKKRKKEMLEASLKKRESFSVKAAFEMGFQAALAGMKVREVTFSKKKKGEKDLYQAWKRGWKIGASALRMGK